MSTFLHAVNHPATIERQRKTIQDNERVIRELEDLNEELKRESIANVKIIRDQNHAIWKLRFTIFVLVALSALVLYQIGPINVWNIARDTFNRSLLGLTPVDLDDPVIKTQSFDTDASAPPSSKDVLGSLGSLGSFKTMESLGSASAKAPSQYVLPSILRGILEGKNANEDSDAAQIVPV